MRNPQLEALPENFHIFETFKSAYFAGSDMQKPAFAALRNVLEPTPIPGCTKMRAVACGSAASLRKYGL
jgi:hypothetical protein